MLARFGRRFARPPGEYWSSERTFFCAVSLLSIESRLPALTPTKRRGRPMRAMSAGRVPAGCAIDADPVAATLEEARHEDRPERGVIDVRVARHHQDVELVPAARMHLLARGGEETRAPDVAGALRTTRLLADLDEVRHTNGAVGCYRAAHHAAKRGRRPPLVFEA